MTLKAHAVALGVAAALAVLHTWPLGRDLAGQSRLDNADTALNTWAVVWVADTLPRRPTHVFDAPIFHPERRTLAYSEHLLAQGAMAIPLRAAGLSPTVIYNLLVLTGFTLSAWAMWWLVATWTGDATAGLVAGAAFAFNAHLLTRFAHLQALHGEFVPLVLYALDRLVVTSRRRDGAWLGCGLVLVGLTSVYLGLFVAGAVVVGVAARIGEWRHRAGATAAALAIAAAVAAIGLAPVLWPYVQVNRDLGLERSLADTAQFSATWRDYLSTAGRLHYAAWSHRFGGAHDALFPGLAVLGLAAVALVSGRDRRRVRMLLAIAAAGVLLSLGPATPIYAWLYEHVTPLRATRVAARWGVLWLTALAVLAGLGVAALRARAGATPRRALAVAALGLVTLEAARTPMAFTATPAVPAIYTRLAGVPGAVVLEFPLYPAAQFNLNAPYLIGQTVHRHPIIAGYSGFAPPRFTARTDALGTFPGIPARQMIRDLGVTHVVLHLAPLVDGFGQSAVDAIDLVPWLRREFADGEARVYRVVE